MSQTPSPASLYGAAAASHLGLAGHGSSSLHDISYIQHLLANQTPVVYTPLDGGANSVPGSSKMNYYSTPNQFFEGLGLNTAAGPQIN